MSDEIPLFGRVISGSHQMPETARKSQSLVLQRLNQPGTATRLARDLGVSEATISRIKTDSMSLFCELLDLLNLQVMDKHIVAVDPKAFESAAYLTGKAMSDTEICKQLLRSTE